jgi:hypothetical protein
MIFFGAAKVIGSCVVYNWVPTVTVTAGAVIGCTFGNSVTSNDDNGEDEKETDDVPGSCCTGTDTAPDSVALELIENVSEAET